MRPILPALLCAAAATLPAAATLDLDLAALRAGPDAAAVRAAAAERPILPRLAAAAEAFRAGTGVDPRQALRRVAVELDDAGGVRAVVAGLPASALRDRLAAIAPLADLRELAPDVLAIGLRGAEAPAAEPAPRTGPGRPVAFHAVPRPEPLLPILRLVESIDASADGAGRLVATVQSPDEDAARAVEARLAELRAHAVPLLPPAAQAVLADVAVARYGSVVTVVAEAPVEARIALLRLAGERIRARMGLAE